LFNSAQRYYGFINILVVIANAELSAFLSQRYRNIFLFFFFVRLYPLLDNIKQSMSRNLYQLALDRDTWRNMEEAYKEKNMEKASLIRAQIEGRE